MRRREFITIIAGVAALWSQAAVAQQSAMPVIGFLRSTPAGPFAHLVAAFRQGLSEAGYVEGKNVTIEQRWADNQIDRLPVLVDELVRQPVTVIVANVLAALAAKNATTTVPILFVTGSDPVKDGLVASLNQPVGNVTGVSQCLRRAGDEVLVQLDAAESVLEQREVQATAQASGQQLIVFDVNSAADIETAFATMAARGVGALYVGTGAFTSSYRALLTALAARNAIPALYPLREFVAVGGLMSYGASIADAYRQVGTYAARILKGERPPDLPVIQAVKFDFVLNLSAAKALGLTLPDRLLALADEVIE